MAKSEKKPVPFWKVMVGLAVILGGAYFYFSSDPNAYEPLKYSEEDVARENPIESTHEMNEGPPIPFLAKDKPQPKIVVPEGTYNFGNVGPKAVVDYQFVIRNEGEAPLTISRAYTTCGCTKATVSASVIPPGKLALVTLTFDAGFHDARGQQVRRGLIIENNDRNNSNAEVWTRASVGY